MAFSPDRNQVVVQEDELTLQMWEYQTATQGRVLEGHSNVVASVAYSSCGRWVISASRDMTVRLWDLEDAEQDHVFGGSWDSDEGVRCLAFSSTGPQFATGDMGGRVCLYDARTRSCSRTLRLRDEILPRSLAYSPDDKQLAIGTASGSVYLWDLCSTDPGIELCGHRSNVQSISYSPCGQWLTTGSRDETVRLWRFQGPGQKGTLSCVSVISGFLGTVRSIVWSPVEPLEFVTGSKDCSVRLWRISTSPTPPTTKAKGDRGCFSVQQLWGSNLGTLCAMDLKFEGAIGLSMMNQRLLVQRSSVPDSWESDGYAASDDEFGWYDEDQWTETGSEDGGGSIAGGEKSEVVEELSEFEWGEDGSEDEWVHDSSDE
ncbi:hypothetical protein EC991_007216 [Linnemannia zychae]|nr:hypothetical protein EC991_007216 [Linnemannia zychae]